ncbi:leucine-rich repeat extensin-like protein 3 isoform X1 [Hyposmocoma kahamanoa]|uniref:leucine-rich repeat extensin-like protein 3 isoform X1 n=1 Tax=Hyposmocoma kahamanoa TaxID=1477025 RepID=UPI000E6D638E|nr:leucine-rich repeat extensin-like protein 3 isoform X1 [Hyposmocoma kahamanoa]
MPPCDASSVGGRRVSTITLRKMLRSLVLMAAVAYAAARPEPPSSYSAPSSSYSAPSSSYSAPSSSYGAPAPQYGPPQQAPIVHKHVYVHVPPPDNEYPAPRKQIYVPPPQKHYKIVFIKAPTPPTPTAPIIPVQPQNEEKTLVYVLVKKPEEQPEIVIPTPAPTQPAKPEVYFIRYKTQKQEGYPAAQSPSSEYGAPASAPSSEYGAPSGSGGGSY